MTDATPFTFFGGPKDGEPVTVGTGPLVEASGLLPHYIEFPWAPDGRYESDEANVRYVWRTIAGEDGG